MTVLLRDREFFTIYTEKDVLVKQSGLTQEKSEWMDA